MASGSSGKTMKNNKYSSGGYRPQGTRAKSKDGRGEILKSNSLLKKGNWNNTVNVGKGFNQSPTKRSKNGESNMSKLGDEPNYSKPIHNKKKNKQGIIDKGEKKRLELINLFR